MPLRRTLVVLAALALAGCGCCDDPDDANIFVSNLTPPAVLEDIVAFQLAPFGEPWTGNLLVGPVFPGETQYVGTFHEDYYDALAELTSGALVEWFDIEACCGDDVYFEVY